MAMLLEFEINTKPIPQARPRFVVRHSGLKHTIGAYDPKQCKIFKEVVAWHAKAAALEHGLKEPTRNPVALSITFHIGENKNGKVKFYTNKPDLDNLAKAVTDALKGVLYVDDSQIVEAHLYKKYGEPMIAIRIETLEVN